MDNQHKRIKGYRDLSQEEIDLMNRIKEKGSELLTLQAELVEHIERQYGEKGQAAAQTDGESPERIEYKRLLDAEPIRWAAIGKTDIQTGIMALVRAVAQPTGI